MPKVKLGDVVERIRDKVDKDNTHLEYYIGGEHYDNGEVCIIKKGILKGSTIGPAFNTHFNPGDVLLMSRNPHLRKAGMVDFEGICSDVSYVCRTKDEETLIQRYLPFIFQTDHFWNFAESNKRGSTNFFLNWSDFEKYEFELPDIEEQEKLTELLWAATDTKYSYMTLLNQIHELVKAQFIDMFGNPVENDRGWKTEPLSKVAPFKPADLPEDDKYWWLNLDMIESNSGKLISKVWAKPEDIGKSTTTFDDSMVLYSKLRPYLNKVIVPDGYGFATTELVTMKPDESKLNKYFLSSLLRGDEFVKYANDISMGAQMPRMPMKVLRNFPCILPPLELQEEFVKFLESAEKSMKEINQSIENITVLVRTIMNQSQIQ